MWLRILDKSWRATTVPQITSGHLTCKTLSRGLIRISNKTRRTKISVTKWDKLRCPQIFWIMSGRVWMCLTQYLMPKSRTTPFLRHSVRRPKMVIATRYSRRPRETTVAAQRARKSFRACNRINQIIWTLFLILLRKSSLRPSRIAKANNIRSSAQEVSRNRPTSRISSLRPSRRVQRTAIRWTILIWSILWARETKVKQWVLFHHSS